MRGCIKGYNQYQQCRNDVRGDGSDCGRSGFRSDLLPHRLLLSIAAEDGQTPSGREALRREALDDKEAVIPRKRSCFSFPFRARISSLAEKTFRWLRPTS